MSRDRHRFGVDLTEEETEEQLTCYISSENRLWTHPIREFDVLLIQIVISSSVADLNSFLTRFRSIRPNWAACDIARRTALHHAVSRANEHLVVVLLSLGANPFLKDNLGQTALHVASRLRDKGTVTHILDHVELYWSNGADAQLHLLNIKDNKGRVSRDADEESNPNQALFSSVVSTASSSSSVSVSIDDLDTDADTIDKDGQIAKGSEGEVHKGRWRGTIVALKMDSAKSTDARFRNEIEILLRLRHPNIVLMMGLNLKHKFIVLEYCSGGSLFDLLHRRGIIDLSWRQRLKILMDIARAMNYLHTLPEIIIHRDLKSLNVLLAEEVVDEYDTPTAKVTDFGLSTRCMDRGIIANNEIVGTYQWMAPEILNGSHQDERIDIYSYGVLMFEVISRSIPYSDLGHTNDKLGKAVVAGLRPNLDMVDRMCPTGIVDTMRRCWSECRNDRPSFEEILQLLDATVLRRVK